MTGKEDGRVFIEGILGRRWDNFGSRIAAVNYHELFLHDSSGEVSGKFKEKLLRLIPKKDLDLVVNAHNKLKNHTL